MNFSLWISRRLSLRRSSSGSAGVVTAIAGVALALMIMEFTIAIVVGFKDGIKERLAGFDAQISIVSPPGDSTIWVRKTPQLQTTLHKTLPEANASLAMRTPGLIKTDDNFEAVIFLSREGNSDFSFERGNIIDGVWPDYTNDTCRNDIVLSKHTAAALDLSIGDKVYTTFFVNGNIKLRRNRIAGIYLSNFGEYDQTVAYASLPALQSIEGADSISGNRLDIRGIDFDSIATQAQLLQNALIDAVVKKNIDTLYPVDNITRTGALYFNWLSLLDTNVIVIFLLMMAVAGLTLISSLFILILDRIPMIGTLRALGASKPQIRKIFINMAMRLVGIGMVIGNVIGIGLLVLQKHTHIIPLDPEMYYLDSVPVEINIWSMLALNFGVIAVSWLILILPARLASNIDPAKTMNYQ